MNIFQLSDSKKIKFEKVKKKRKGGIENRKQLSLFAAEPKILLLTPSGLFEKALKLDEDESPYAKNFYLQAIEENDCPADAYCNLGILESEQGNTIKAFAYFLNALRIEPAHVEAHFNLGNLYLEKDDFPLAKLHFELSIELEPDFPSSYFNLGLTYALMGCLDDAERYLLLYKELVSHEEAENADLILAQIKNIGK